MKCAYHWSAWTALLLLYGCESWFRLNVVTEVEDGDERATVVFDVPVPIAPEVLRAFELKPAQILDGLRPTLRLEAECLALGKDSQSKPVDTRQMGTDKGRAPASPVRCTEDYGSGEVEVYPDFAAALAASPKDRLTLDRAKDVAKEILLSNQILPEDESRDDARETTAAFDRQVVVQHRRAERAPAGGATAPTASPPDSFLIYSSLVRSVGKYPVDGPGSRMALATDRQGKVQGFVRAWRSASNGIEVKARHSPEQVRAEIEAQLLATRPRSSVHVQKIDLVYYDGNDKLLQPAYRYVVEVTPASNSLGHAEHLVGYVRYGDTSEEVPTLGDVASSLRLARRLDEMAPPTQSGAPVLLGAYVARDDSQDWVNDALGFLAEASASRHVSFVPTQRVSATPAMFTTESGLYVNSVDLAIVEAHGRPWAFATERDCCSPVFFHTDFNGTPSGLQLGGGLKGGRLQHLVMHSCRVVASPDETPDWATPWWTVFNGLRTVVGYRTSMYINDGAGAMFGRSIGAGAPVLAAWFNSVASLNAYGRDPQHRFYCEGEQSMGRPAAISVCGAEVERVGEGPAFSGPPTCLDAWWISDATPAAE